MGVGLRVPQDRVRGWDVAGHVEAADANVTGFQPGDQVFGTFDRSFAEYALVRQDRCAAKPANLTFELGGGGARLRGYRPAGRSRPGTGQPGQKVLIIGAAGGARTFAVQLAKAFGAAVAEGIEVGARVPAVRDGLGTDLDPAVCIAGLDDQNGGQRPVTLVRGFAGARRAL